MRYTRPSVLSVLAAAPLGCLTSPRTTLWDDIRVRHTVNVTMANWEALGTPPAGTTIDLYIALKAQHESALTDALYEVSTPGHPQYGSYLSKEQVAELVAPHPNTLDLVNTWLENSGISSSSVSRTHGGGWLTITNVPVSQADHLLGASYQIYRHTGTNETVPILRTASYALPAALNDHVRGVAPTTHFGSPQQTPRKRFRGEVVAMKNATSSGERVTVLSRSDGDDDDDDEDEDVDPPFLRWLYKTAAYVPAATNNMLGVVGYDDSYSNQADLTAFMNEFRKDADPAATYSFKVERVNGGGDDPSNPGSEASSNVQYAAAMAYPTPLVFYSTGGGLVIFNNEPAPGDAILEWLKFMLALEPEDLPQTISVSYGDDELGLPQEYVVPLCELFAQLGALGVSVLFSSGNYGVGRGNCKDRSGKVQFHLLFPASCPYVTSVGGTTGGRDEYHPEEGASLSQGGFSLLFERPPYQKDAVPPFFKQLGGRYSGLYNPEGRGGPDIAAQALQYLICIKGEPYAVSGTSCATPTVAGIISLLNDYQLSRGRKPLGFLNPWLYGQGISGFTDITSGSNPGCNTDGFSAIVGWDPVTGLGTPNFEVLQTVLPTQGSSQGSGSGS